MGFSETFLTTGLPAGRTATELLFDVLISPRLGSDSTAKAPLSNWPDLVDWPNVDPTWEVVVKQGDQEFTFTATELADAYDSDAWKHLFPSDQLQQPYRAVSHANAPIFSYPAAAIRDAVRDIHVKALVNARNEFPKVEDLRADETFGCVMEAANPATADAMQAQQLNGPVADADVECHQAFAMTGLVHGVRPGSQPGATITSVSPNPVRNYSNALITVKGFKLGHTTSVAVYNGGTPTGAIFTIVSDTEITFHAPDITNPGDMSIVVNTLDDGSATAPITYVQPGPPSVTAVEPDEVNVLPPAGPTYVDVVVRGENLGGANRVLLTRPNPHFPSDPNPPLEWTTGIRFNETETSFTVRIKDDTPFGNWYVRVRTPIGENGETDGAKLFVNRNPLK